MGGVGQMGITSGGQDTIKPKDFLNFEQVNARPSTGLRTGFD
jgi:hypothetical protein